MAIYRIRIERIEVVPDTEPQWKSNAKPDGCSGYVTPPEGATKRVSEQVFDQTVETLDLPGLVRAINTPGALGA